MNALVKKNPVLSWKLMMVSLAFLAVTAIHFITEGFAHTQDYADVMASVQKQDNRYVWVETEGYDNEACDILPDSTLSYVLAKNKMWRAAEIVSYTDEQETNAANANVRKFLVKVKAWDWVMRDQQTAHEQETQLAISYLCSDFHTRKTIGPVAVSSAIN